MKVESITDSHGNLEFSPKVFLMEAQIPEINRPIALHLTLNPERKCAWWGDTTRGHSIRYTSYEASESSISIQDEDGHSWVFTPLTLELFKDKATQYLTPLEKPFTSDEELQTFYSEMW